MGKRKEPTFPDGSKLNPPSLQSAHARTTEKNQWRDYGQLPESTKASGLALQFPFLSFALPSETEVLKKTRPLSAPGRNPSWTQVVGTRELFKILGLLCSD